MFNSKSWKWSSWHKFISSRNNVEFNNVFRPISEKETHFFSSKGHDAPALYACYEAFGQMKNFSIKNLRRIEGPSGHPDVKIPKVNFNTGS